MKEKRNWAQRLTDAAELYGEALPGVPLVEIYGENRVLIECHRGVVEYGCQKIGVRVSIGIICVTGCDLQVRLMTRERLVISGRITGVQLIRR